MLEEQQQKTVVLDSTCYNKFLYALNSASTKRQYPKRLQNFLDFLKIDGETIEKKANKLYHILQIKDRDWIETTLIDYFIYQNKRAASGEISINTIRNYYKPIKLFFEMINILVNWKLISKGIMKGDRVASDRPPFNPQIAVSGRNVYIVWTDTTPGNFEIFFKRSTDFGQSFEDTRNLSDNTGTSSGPQIAISGGNNVFVVWSDNTLGGFANIFYTRSIDRGESFGNIQNISNNNVELIESFDPQIVVSGQDLYVIWTNAEITTSNLDIFFKRSTDGGQTFEDAQNLSDNAGGSQGPRIAIS